eukprot:4328493-Amphidinium_carterae.2
MELLMDNAQVQPWWQYEDDVSKNNKWTVQCSAKIIKKGEGIRWVVTDRHGFFYNILIPKTSRHCYTTDVASAFLNTPVDEEVLVQPPREYCHNRVNKPKIFVYGLGFNRLQSDACIFGNVNATVYLTAYVDYLLVEGNPSTVKPCLEQFKVRLELYWSFLAS